MLRGLSLIDIIRDINEPFSEFQAKDIIKDLLYGISYIHNKHFMNRDIKIDNLKYSSLAHNKILKILDFNLGTSFKPGESTILKTGSEYSSSPQVTLGINYTEKCDIWSIGIVLYTLLHLYHPYIFNRFDIMKEDIEKTRFTYDFFNYLTISDNAKSLLVRLLTYEDSLRPSAESLLSDILLKAEASNMTDKEKHLIFSNLKTNLVR